jgi:hypothetical protein
MDEKTYRFAVHGTAADQQTWGVSGTVECLPGDFPAACDLALRQSFIKLTKGEAVFGFPGMGCRGPYGITKFTIELVLQ